MTSPLQRIRSAFNRQPSQSPPPQSLTLDDPPLTPIELNGYDNATTHKLLNTKLAEQLRKHLPSIIQINHAWNLIYSIHQSGTSLQTLYANCKNDINVNGGNMNRRRGYIIIVQDRNHNIFGAYINDYLHIQEGKSFYGNGDCFLWKLSNEDGNLKVYKYTGQNDFIIYSDSNFISIGSGNGKFGLWIDSNLEIGASDSVETFDNEPLSDSSKFHILALEVWKVY